MQWQVYSDKKCDLSWWQKMGKYQIFTLQCWCKLIRCLNCCVFCTEKQTDKRWKWENRLILRESYESFDKHITLKPNHQLNVLLYSYISLDFPISAIYLNANVCALVHLSIWGCKQSLWKMNLGLSNLNTLVLNPLQSDSPAYPPRVMWIGLSLYSRAKQFFGGLWCTLRHY